MRNKKDRICHALGSEFICLLIFAPLARFVFGFELHLLGVMTLAGFIVANFWHCFYNILFNRSMRR